MTRFAIPTADCEVNVRITLPDFNRVDESRSADLGRFILDTRNILVEEVGWDRRLIIPLRFDAADSAEILEWYSLSGTMSVGYRDARPIGLFFPESLRGLSEWLWFLSPEEIQRIAREKPSATGTIDLFPSIRGLVVDRRGSARAGGVCPISSLQGSRISLSNPNWYEMLRHLSPTLLVASVPLPISDVVDTHPSWLQASTELEDAWKHLMVYGSEYASIKKAYDALTRVLGVRNPTKMEQLEEVLTQLSPDLRGSKLTAIKELLAGVGQMGQRLGHHSEDMEEADRPPVRFWEAQILLSILHLAVGYILRLQAEDGDHETP